jgi:hypothetical protein
MYYDPTMNRKDKLDAFCEQIRRDMDFCAISKKTVMTSVYSLKGMIAAQIDQQTSPKLYIIASHNLRRPAEMTRMIVDHARMIVDHIHAADDKS